MSLKEPDEHNLLTTQRMSGLAAPEDVDTPTGRIPRTNESLALMGNIDFEGSLSLPELEHYQPLIAGQIIFCRGRLSMVEKIFTCEVLGEVVVIEDRSDSTHISYKVTLLKETSAEDNTQNFIHFAAAKSRKILKITYDLRDYVAGQVKMDSGTIEELLVELKAAQDSLNELFSSVKGGESSTDLSLSILTSVLHNIRNHFNKLGYLKTHIRIPGMDIDTTLKATDIAIKSIEFELEILNKLNEVRSTTLKDLVAEIIEINPVMHSECTRVMADATLTGKTKIVAITLNQVLHNAIKYTGGFIDDSPLLRNYLANIGRIDLIEQLDESGTIAITDKYGNYIYDFLAPRINAFVDGIEVVLEVEDFGPGFPVDDEEKMWAITQGYERVKDGDLQTKPGSGLGLAMLRLISSHITSVEISHSAYNKEFSPGGVFVIRCRFQ